MPNGYAGSYCFVPSPSESNVIIKLSVLKRLRVTKSLQVMAKIKQVNKAEPWTWSSTFLPYIKTPLFATI